MNNPLTFMTPKLGVFSSKTQQFLAFKPGFKDNLITTPCLQHTYIAELFNGNYGLNKNDKTFIFTARLNNSLQ